VKRAPVVLERLLAALVARADADELRSIALDVEDWPELLISAANNGVACMVFEALRSASVEVPAEVARKAEKLSALQGLENELSLRALRRCLEVLEEATIETVVLKGPLLAERLYGSALARPCLDIDLLVDERNLERGRDALARVGYRAGDDRQVEHELDHHSVSLFHDAYPILELHFLAYEGFGVKVEAAPLVARSVTWKSAQVGEFSARVLAPDDELVHLAVHGAGHRFDRLMWLYDIALYLRSHPELTTAILLERARSLNVERAVAATLIYVQRTLGAKDVEQPSIDPAMRLALPLFGAHVEPRLQKSLGSFFTLASYSLLADSPVLALRFIAKKLTVDLPRRFSKNG
jgi:hypothetical protein